MKRPTTSYLIFTLLVAFWCSLILAAPILRSGMGSTMHLSGMVYDAFGAVCHQIGDRSFHLEGEKFAVCARCASLYFGFCFSLFLMPFASRSLKRIVPPNAVLAVPAFLMFIDVSFTLVGVHESTLFTRAITGGSLGIVLPWYIVPPLIDALERLRFQIRTRRLPLLPGD